MTKILSNSSKIDADRHQRKLLRIVLAVLFVFSLLIGGLNIVYFSSYQVASFNFISATSSMLIGFYFHRCQNLKLASWLLIATVLFNLSFFIVSAKAAAYSVIWITVLPPLAFFLLGRRAGSWVTGIAFAAVIGYLIYFLPELPALRLSIGAILNISEVLIILWLLFRFYESSRQAAFAELGRLSMVDKLTGVYNRSKLDDLLEYHIQLTSRALQPLVVALIDIDHFKQVNDHYGHLQGDAVLQQVAGALNSRLRATDGFGRWGGEEFLLICPNTTLAEGLNLAEALRSHIEQSVKLDGQPVTLSVGVTAVSATTTPADVIRYADAALYQAKNSGRNCVVAYQE